MTARRARHAFILLLLFLVRSGATSAVAECSSFHHTEQPEFAAETSHAGAHPAPAEAPPCPHEEHHASTDCHLMVGCSQSVSMIALAIEPPNLADHRDAMFALHQQIHPRSIAPANPPPRS